MLRMLREPALTRVLAVTLLVSMLVLSAPFSLPIVHWLLALL